MRKESRTFSAYNMSVSQNPLNLRNRGRGWHCFPLKRIEAFLCFVSVAEGEKHSPPSSRYMIRYGHSCKTLKNNEKERNGTTLFFFYQNDNNTQRPSGLFTVFPGSFNNAGKSVRPVIRFMFMQGTGAKLSTTSKFYTSVLTACNFIRILNAYAVT